MVQAKKEPPILRSEAFLVHHQRERLENSAVHCFLATGPRKANASRTAAQHEAVPTVKS